MVRARLEEWFGAADRRAGGWLSTGRRAYQQFQFHGGTTAATSLAFYNVFSVFPLFLLLTAALSTFLATEEAQSRVVDIVSVYLPTASAVELVQDNIQRVVAARGAISLAAGASLLWGASGIFNVARAAINRAWEVDRPRPFWRQRLLAVGSVLTLGALLLLSIALTGFFGLIRSLQIPMLGWQPLQSNVLWGWATQLLTLAVTFLLFAGLYRFFPNTRVRGSDIWPGALLASLLWEGAKNGFAWYLSNFARYNLVYGSLGAIVALLVWSYVTGMIVLLGAEFTAQTARRRELRAA